MTLYTDPYFPSLWISRQPGMRQFDRDVVTALANWNMTLKAILDGGISFTDNVDCVIVSYTSNATPDTQDTVAHTLGKTPTGYIPIAKNKAADVYTSAAHDGTNLYLKCTVASATISLLVF